MGEMTIKLPGGVELPFVQMIAIRRVGDELGEFEWHMNECGCCALVHPKGQHDRGYLVSRDGEANWLGPR